MAVLAAAIQSFVLIIGWAFDRTIFSPRVLFVGPLAISLLLVSLDAANPAALLVLAGGGVAFLVGTVTADRVKTVQASASPPSGIWRVNWQRLLLGHWVLVVGGTIALVASCLALGMVPIVSLILGMTDINVVNDAIARSHPPLLAGLIQSAGRALSVTSTFLLLADRLGVDAPPRWARRSWVLGALLVMALSSYLGKRQGLVDAGTTFLAMAAFSQGRSFADLISLTVRHPPFTVGRRVLLSLALVIGLGSLATVVSSAVQGARAGSHTEVSTKDFVDLSLSAPTRNFEALANQGFEPLGGTYLLASLVPTKLHSVISVLGGPDLGAPTRLIRQISIEFPQLTAPLTYAGRVFLDFGAVGVWAFSVVLGFATQFAYRRRLTGVGFAIYSLLVWPLAAAVSDNWFYLPSGLYFPIALVAGLFAIATRRVEPSAPARPSR